MKSDVTFRGGSAADAKACGEICFNAFCAFASKHNFPPDFPSPDASVGLMGMIFSMPNVYSVIAESNGRIVASNFLWEGDTIAGVGPITVDPSVQNGAVGRRLMERVLERAAEKRLAGVRLVQAGYHNRSLSLYSKLGFDVREPLVTLQGKPIQKSITGFPVRTATHADIQGCNALCLRVHGHNRNAELSAAIERNIARVVEREGRIAGYCTGIGFFSHAVCESNDDLKALIAAAPEFAGPGFLLPMCYGDVFRWCLKNGLQVVQPMNLMSLGLYNEPKGAFLPSVLY